MWTRGVVKFMCEVTAVMETIDEKKSVKVRWALRRDSLPLAHIRQAFLKGKRSISPDALLWRRR